MINDVEPLFMYPLASCMFLERCLFRSSAHFLIFFLYWASWAICILWKLIFCCFVCKHFLPFWELSFCFVYSFLCWAKAFNFNWVPFVYFYFYYSGRWVKKDLAMMYVKECSKFSSKSFILSHLTFRFLIHFEFIFMYGVRECSSFILLHVAVQFSQHHLLKRLSFIHCIFLPPLS